VAVAALLAVAVTGCKAEGQVPLTSPLDGGNGAACDPPSVTLAGIPTGNGLLTSVANGSGGVLTMSAFLDDKGGAYQLSGVVVLARPGSTGGTGDPATMASSAVERPANQISTAGVRSGAGDIVTVNLSYASLGPGTYPLYFVGSYTGHIVGCGGGDSGATPLVVALGDFVT